MTNIVDRSQYTMPRVTVAVCAYNQAQYVEAALNSAFGQSYENVEFVVVDDHSSDGTPNKIQEVLDATEMNVKFIRRKSNGGQMAAMLDALAASTSPFIVWVDGDDLLKPDFVQTHIRYHLNATAGCAFTSSNMAVIDFRGQMISGAVPFLSNSFVLRPQSGDIEIRPLSHDREPETAVLLPKGYRNWAWSATSGMMFRTSVIKLIRPERPEMIRISADNYFARFAHVVGGSLVIPTVLGFYRIHGNNNFSRFEILGDRIKGAKNSTEQIDAMNEEFAKVLAREPAIVASCIDATDLYRIVKRIGTSKRSMGLLLQNKVLWKELPLRKKISLIVRNVRLRFRGTRDDAQHPPSRNKLFQVFAWR